VFIGERERWEGEMSHTEVLNPDPVTGSPTESPAPSSNPMNVRRVLLLALPIVGENILQTGVGAVDTLLVSRIGDDAIAGVGIGAELVFFLLAILSAVSIGATVLVAQAIGAGDRDRANLFARQAISWGILISIPLSILGFLFSDSLIGLFNAEPEVSQLAVEYFEVIAVTVIVLLLSYLCGAVLRGSGDSRTPLKAAVLANIFNIFFSYGLAFGEFGMPELGVAGTAWGATIGRGIAAIYMMRVLWLGRSTISIHARTGWLPKWNVGTRLFRLGIPAAIEQLLVEGGFLALVVIVASIGTNALAAQQIAFTAMSLGILPGFAFAIAATALVGQSIGAKEHEDARKASSIAQRLCLGWMVVGAIPLFLFARPILAFFSQDAEVIDIGTNGVRAIALSLPLWGAWSVSAGALRGSGDTRSPMLRGVFAVWLSVLLGWIGVKFFDQTVAYVWGIFALTLPIAVFGNIRAFYRRSRELEINEPETFEIPAAGYHP
jgi:putative MATE family efflux protein